MNGSARSSVAFVLALVLLALGAGRGADAQESRGAITGRVTDNTGAIVPGAIVTVVNLATNATTTVPANDAGQYTALYLSPGAYRVTVELTGFAKTVAESVQVGVGTRALLDLQLTPAGVAETVEVAAARPALSETSATIGTVISSTLIAELPLGDGTAYSLTRLAAGSTFEGGYALQRPMDNGNLTGLSVGGVGRSEFSLDGSNNNVGVGMGISPPADAVQEFKVETAAYDAQVGHTGAGTVNLALKSGTNALRGATYVFNRDDARAANDFASNSQGRATAARNYTRYGVTAGGPVRRNRTFFMVSYEKLQDDQVEPVFRTVPTEKMRQGDFSELLPAVRIYDPLTAQRQADGRIVRQPFPGNVIPAARLNPIAQKALSYYPLPNAAAAADGSRNYFAQQPWTYAYNLVMTRVDHEFSPSQRTYVRFIRNTRDEERSDWAGIQNGVAITRGVDNRNNYNLTLGHTMVLSPTLFLDVKANALRFEQGQRPYENVNPAELGFSGPALDVMRGYDYIPRFDIERFDVIGAATPAFGAARVQPYYNYSFNPTLTKVAGRHTVKAGYDARVLRENRLDVAYQGGRYTLNGDYTRESSTSANQFGQGLASFMLGLPTSGFIDTAATRANQTAAHGLFVQDDWRVSSRLTLNLGLRYDLELGMTERYDRNIRGFDLTSSNPIEAAAQAAYARAPIPQVAPADFNVPGGYAFTTRDSRAAWNADRNNVQPRLGFAYKAAEKTVVRGGAGLFVPLFEINGVNQIGFSRATNMTVTQDQGLTFLSDLTSPFPNGLLEPVGSSLGLRTNLGNSAGSATAPVIPVDRKNAQYWHFSIGLQRELPWNMVAEASYVGQRGQNLAVAQQLNFVPEQYRTASPFRDTAAETFLTTPVANPFAGLLPDAPGVNGATIPRSRLLVDYPQFNDLYVETYEGSNRYNALLLSLDKRFTNGFSLLANYTYSSLREKVTRLNPWEGLEDRVALRDRPHRVALATVAQLPFGRDRAWGSRWHPVVDGVLGGWQVTANYQYQTGAPLEWGNVYYDASRDPRELVARVGQTDDQRRKIGIDVPAWDLSGFYFHDATVQTNGADDRTKQIADNRIALGAANIRRFPTTLPNFRHTNQHSLDAGITKNFRFGRNVRLQLRAEAINALNFTIFRDTTVDRNPRNATFGFVNDPGASIVVIRPRDIQLGARLTF
jgi:hypothetical protein